MLGLLELNWPEAFSLKLKLEIKLKGNTTASVIWGVSFYPIKSVCPITDANVDISKNLDGEAICRGLYIRNSSIIIHLFHYCCTARPYVHCTRHIFFTSSSSLQLLLNMYFGVMEISAGPGRLSLARKKTNVIFWFVSLDERIASLCICRIAAGFFSLRCFYCHMPSLRFVYIYIVYIRICSMYKIISACVSKVTRF